MTREVYFLQELGTGAIKIGVTGNLNARLSAIRTGTSNAIMVLGSVRADRQFERELHRKFAYARIRGEWFRPVGELFKCIGELTGFDLADLVVSPEEEGTPTVNTISAVL
jgi:hypothetical protein